MGWGSRSQERSAQLKYGHLIRPSPINRLVRFEHMNTKRHVHVQACFSFCLGVDSSPTCVRSFQKELLAAMLALHWILRPMIIFALASIRTDAFG